MTSIFNIVLECYSINPILEKSRNFKWLGEQHIQNLPRLKVHNSIEFLMINIKKIKLTLEEDIILKQNKLKLQFPFTYDDFITFARQLASTLANQNSVSWLKNLEYMKDFILAPMMISSKEVIIGIIILDEIILKPILTPMDILESNNYLAQINFNNPIAEKGDEWKCDILNGILAMSKNKISTRTKLYIINCRGYIPPVLIQKMPKQITAINFFRKLQA